MKDIPFSKYTSFGNNFVILDETRGPIFTEKEKARFAYQATNGCFGIGCDNFLVVQSCTPEILNSINQNHRYWDHLPDFKKADYIFRMFEPDGTEAFSCGNGLMCIANYLYRCSGKFSARIMTEIPTKTPNVVSIGTELSDGLSWANLGRPRRIPPNMAKHSSFRPLDPVIDMIPGLTIKDFRKSDKVQFLNKESALVLKGYLVFTGEPHLVIFTDTGVSLSEAPSLLFPPQPVMANKTPFTIEKRINTSSALLDFIGNYFVREYSGIFPCGININFVHHDSKTGAFLYRCFERGINRETLACGTGALAVAYVASRLELTDTNCIRVWPYRCRWYVPDAEIRVKDHNGEWHLYGKPKKLFEGNYALESEINIPQDPSNDSETEINSDPHFQDTAIGTEADLI